MTHCATRPMTRLTVAAACVSVLALSGCGSSNHPSTISKGANPATTPSTTDTAGPATTAAPAAACQATTPTADLTKKPVVVPPKAPAPTKTTTIDLVCGTGAEAKAGAMVTVKYVGVLYQGGKEFDSSWKNGPTDTLPYTVAAGQLIPGFDQGSVGMKVGGRREILIPSAEGYGPQGSPPVIGPNADLIFVIDLVSAS